MTNSCFTRSVTSHSRQARKTLCQHAVQVKAGSDMFISVWNLHRSPQYWERPNEFDPDRFDVDAIPNKVTENFAYLPFGGGRRKCIGEDGSVC